MFDITTRDIKYLQGVGPVSYTHLDVYKRQGFLGAFFKRGVFLFKRWIRISKRMWKDFENLSQDVAILVASFSESCSRICRFLV